METTDMQSKSTKIRLDELRELFDGGYITEGEFKIARVNILGESGIDVVTQVQHAHRAYFQEEEEEAESRSGYGGCGCFLLTLLLAVLFVLGVAFFAAPYWPEEWGGASARGAREWFTAKSTELMGGFIGSSADGVQLPDPVVSGDAVESGQTDGAVNPTAAPELPEELSGDASFISIDLNATPRPLAVPDPIPPALTVVEIQPPVSEEPEAEEPEVIPTALSADLPAEGPVVRGIVTAQNARIRSEPDTSTNGNVVGWARSGDRFVVLEEGTGRDGSRWYRIEYESEDKRGWISGSLVRLER